LFSDAADLVLLQRAQQLDLHRGGHLADLVEQQRPAAGSLEQARSVLRRAGERTARMSEQLALEQRLGDGSAVDRDERTGRACGFLVEEPCDPLLARSTLAGDEHGGVDLGHAARQLHELPHRGALRDDAERLLDVARHPDERSPVSVELALGGLQGLRDAMERDLEALLEAARLEEVQLLGALAAPIFTRAREQVARGIALACATILEDVRVLAGDPAQVAAREAADRPAYGHLGAPEVKEVLLGFVGGDDHRAGLGQRPATAGLDAEQALEGVDASARAPPFLVALPRELGPHRLGHSPAVGEAELGEYGARGRDPEILHEILTQESHRDRVEQQRALTCKADHAAVRVQFQEFLVVQIIRAHPVFLLRIDGHGTSF